MDFFDKLGDFFNALTGFVERMVELTRITAQAGAMAAAARGAGRSTGRTR